MNQEQFLSNMQLVFEELAKSSVGASVFCNITALYTSYRLNEIIKEKAIDNAVNLFMQNQDLKKEIEGLRAYLSDLTQIREK